MKKRLQTVFTSLWLIVAVAVGVRVLYAWQQERKTPHRILATVPFAQETGNIAESLASGRGFSSPFRIPTGPTAWLAPVYPLLLAGIFRLWGIFTLRSFFAAVSLNILFSAGATVSLFFAGKRATGLGVGAGAAWLWAVFPNAFIIPFQWIWDTSLSALLAATILWATLALAESKRARAWIGYGLLWGLVLLTNPALGSLAPFLLGWAAWRARRTGRPWIARPALAAAVMALCCVPWTLRNYAEFHRWIPLRSDSPFELWIGNNEVVDPNGPDAAARITAYGQVRAYAKMGETAFLQDKWERSVRFIRTHPRLERWLTGRRLLAFWTDSPTPAIDFRATDSPFIRFLFLVNGLAALGALGGIVALFWRRNPYAFPLTVVPIVFPCLYYVTHASLRYRAPIDPVIVLLGAALWGAIIRRKAASRGPLAKSSFG